MYRCSNNSIDRCDGKSFDTFNSNHKSEDETPTEKVVMESDQQDGKSDFRKTKMYRQLRPLLVCMRLFGLYFTRAKTLDGKLQTEKVVWWCAFVSVFMIVNVIRSMTTFYIGESYEHPFFQKAMFLIWSSECTLKVVVLFIFCYRQDGLPEYFTLWSKMCHGIGLDKFCKLLLIKAIVATWIFIIFNSVVFTLVLIYVPILDDIYLEVSWRHANLYRTKYQFKMLLGGLAIFNSSSSLFPIALYTILCFALGLQFQKLTKELSSAISNEGHLEGNLEDFRLRHEDLCSLVTTLNRVYMPIIAAAYAANIPMFCIVMYTLIYSIDIHISIVLINLFWLTFLLMHLLIISSVAAWLSSQAHSALEHIYRLRAHGQSIKDLQLQITIFLSRLTGTQIGLSACHLFVVDRPTILTIAGMMVTYFVLLLQFKLPVGSGVCCCNGTVPENNSVLLINAG
ncbi:hypothetical protein ACJMK2_020269 [Sinanodonta woodiana]|uniref:Gustatory receptor n=1 Tax=Sinanodonta woodiana TaxID=1069815 RepID=A0ABD3U189_SINWO